MSHPIRTVDGMSRATDIMVGGESPWEIARAFPYVQLTRRSSKQLEIRMKTPDDRGWAFVRALEQLTTYVASIPEKPPRQSRREAEAIVEARLTGGD